MPQLINEANENVTVLYDKTELRNLNILIKYLLSNCFNLKLFSNVVEMELTYNDQRIFKMHDLMGSDLYTPMKPSLRSK